MKWSIRSRAVFAPLVACSLALSACGHGISVAVDPTDFIESVRFIDVEDLPIPVSMQEAYHDAEFRGAHLLPGSEPRRLLIAVFGNMCQPTVTVAGSNETGPPQLEVNVSYPPHHTCEEILLMWPIEVTLARDVDPATVVVEVTRQGS